MDFFRSITLSENTLLFCLFLPYLYFIYRMKYWYKPTFIKQLDFCLAAFAALCAIFICLQLFEQVGAPGRTSGATKLFIMHLAPLVLTLLIVSQERLITKAILKQLPQGVNGLPGGGKDSTGFNPAPANDTVEFVGWDQLVVSQELKDELVSVVQLLKEPDAATKYGIETPKGILLYGPPGTGKTTIAKAIASNAGMSFFVLKADEVVSKWVGESEKNLSRLFDAAAKHAPSVIFIDEIDSIGKSRTGSYAWADNLLNHLLQLIDGVVKREGLYIIAATNRADLVDPALTRGGRLSRVIEIPLPNFQARMRLFEVYLSKLRLQDELNLEVLAELTENRSAADIKEICNQAGLRAFRREAGSKKKDYSVSYEDVEFALGQVLGE